MDTRAFWQGVEQIASEYNIGRHPLAQLARDGKAARQQLEQFAIEHYERRRMRQPRSPQILWSSKVGADVMSHYLLAIAKTAGVGLIPRGNSKND